MSAKKKKHKAPSRSKAKTKRKKHAPSLPPASKKTSQRSKARVSPTRATAKAQGKLRRSSTPERKPRSRPKQKPQLTQDGPRSRLSIPEQFARAAQARASIARAEKKKRGGLKEATRGKPRTRLAEIEKTKPRPKTKSKSKGSSSPRARSKPPKAAKRRGRKPWEQAPGSLPVSQLRAERPIARAFLEALGSHAYPGRFSTALNADKTIDGQAQIAKPVDTRISTFVDALESQYWMVLDRYPTIKDWWIRLGAQFARTENEWRKYQLELFQGRETTFTNQTRLAEDAAEVWKALRTIIRNVINAYQEPNPRTRQLRPVYELTHVLIRIHRGAEAPLY